MKEKLSGSFLRMLFSVVLCISGLSSTLIAQTWTSVDGGGTYGISSTTSSNSNFPSVAVLNGAIYTIWQEYTGTAYEVHVKKYDGTNWVTAGNSAGSSLLYSCTYSLMYPKLVYYNNALYAAWSGFDAGIYVVHVMKYDGSSWSFTQDYMVGEGRSNINNGITANAMKIDLCVFNNELYATWVEQDHLGGGFYNVRISKFNGTTWTSVDGNGNYGINYNTMVSASYPTLCVFNNALYAAWTESNISAVQVRVRRYDGSNTWTFVDGNGVDGLNYSTTTTPYDVPFSLSSYSGKMYAFWTENNKLRVKRYDETNGWTTDIDGGNGWNHNGALGAYCPNSIIYNNLMYVAWEQNPVPRQVRVVSFDGTTKTFIDGNVAAIGINNTTANRGHFPKLLGYKGDLMAVWSEELTSTSGSANQIRAKKYSLPPFVESVSVPANGTYITGQTLNFAVNYSKDVVISGGTPYIPITLNTGGTVNATYTGGSGTNTLTYSYTIASGNEDPDGILVGSAISNGGATLQSEDAAPLPANLTLNNVGSTTSVLVDGAGPTISSVSSITADGYYNAGDVIAITLSCSEAALVTGTPSLALNSGGTASYASGSGTAVLRFNYTVASGQNSADLDYSATNALSLSGGTLRDGNSNNATLTLPTVGGINSLGGQKNIVIDNTAPSVTITSPASDPTNATIPVTITFSEPVTGFVVSDITVTNGMAGSFSTVNAYTYNATISPVGIGTVTVNIAGSVATDAAGNNNTAATALSRVFDNIAPAAPTISGVSSGSYNSDQIFTVSGEAGATIEYSVNNGGAWTAYSGAVTLSAEGIYNVLARQTDLAGNGPTTSGTIMLTIDKSGPAAPTITGISSGSYNSDQIFTVSGEAGATIEYSTNNGGLWTAYSGAVILSAEGTYQVLARQTDLAGNGPTTSGTITLTIDKSAPAAPTITGISSGSYNSDQIFTVSGEAGATIEYSVNNGGAWTAYSGAVTLSAEGTYHVLARQTDQAGNGPTASGTITLTIDKSAPAAPIITGISSGSYNSDQTFTVSGEAGATIEYSTNNGGLWTAYSGAVTLSAEGTYQVLARQTDQTGNGPITSGVITLIIDIVSPTVNVSSTVGDPTNATPIPVSITFSEPVAGFDATDITVGNATASNLQTSDNINWTADISPIGMGAFSVEIYAGVVQDLAGNSNTASTYFQRTYDPVAPTVVLSSTSSDPTNDHPIVVSIAFSETVFNLDLSDIIVGNGTASNLQMLDYYQHWTVDIDPASNGIVTVDIPVGAAQDYATNNNIAAAQLSRTYVNLAPTVTTEAVTGIGTTTATGNGTITDLGSSNPTAYGVCWNTTGAPTTADNSVDNGSSSSTGAFVAPMNSLSDNTTYYVRAYAINASGTSYGSEVSFTTIAQLPSIAFTLTSSGDLESVSTALLQVDLSSASGLPVTVDYAVSGTATGSGTDYTLDNGTLTISAGATSNNITITSIVDDLLDEGDETLIITLSNPVNATLGSNTVHTYTITDNDNTTGFSDLTNVHLSVYPNPFTNIIHINNRDNDISYIIISDLSGKIVLKTDLKGEKDINVNHLISGVYLVSLVKANDEIQIIKAVKK